MPTSNPPSVSIFLTVQGAPKQVKINGITRSKQSSISRDKGIARIADSSAREASEKLVWSPNDGERGLMLLVHTVATVYVRGKLSSRHKKEPNRPTWDKSLLPVTNTNSISTGDVTNGSKASARELKPSVCAPDYTNTLVEIWVFSERSPKHDNPTHKNGSIRLDLFLVYGEHNVVGA